MSNNKSISPNLYAIVRYGVYFEGDELEKVLHKDLPIEEAIKLLDSYEITNIHKYYICKIEELYI